MTPEEEQSVRSLSTAYKRWETMPPLYLIVPRTEALAIVLACQTMMTHPEASDSLKVRWESIGRQVQTLVCDDPALYTMLELGWDRTQDVDPEDQAAEDQHECVPAVTAGTQPCGAQCLMPTTCSYVSAAHAATCRMEAGQ